MKHWMMATMTAITLGFGLACGGGSEPAPAQASAAGAAAKLTKPLNKAQAATAKKVGEAKKKNGTVSSDGSKKLQVERKKQKSPSGEVVWVIVEEWVLVDEWHDEIWVVDGWVDSDDVLLVSLDDFGGDLVLIEEVDDLAVDAFDELVAEAVDQAVDEAVQQAVEDAVDEAIANEDAAAHDDEVGGD